MEIKGRNRLSLLQTVVTTVATDIAKIPKAQSANPDLDQRLQA